MYYRQICNKEIVSTVRFIFYPRCIFLLTPLEKNLGAATVSNTEFLLWETGKLGALKKDIWVLWKTPLFLGVVWSSHLFFYTKKKIQIYMIEMFHCHWLNKNKYKLDKLNLTRLWVLVTIYQKNTWLFVLVTIYPK